MTKINRAKRIITTWLVVSSFLFVVATGLYIEKVNSALEESAASACSNPENPGVTTLQGCIDACNAGGFGDCENVCPSWCQVGLGGQQGGSQSGGQQGGEPGHRTNACSTPGGYCCGTEGWFTHEELAGRTCDQFLDEEFGVTPCYNTVPYSCVINECSAGQTECVSGGVERTCFQENSNTVWRTTGNCNDTSEHADAPNPPTVPMLSASISLLPSCPANSQARGATAIAPDSNGNACGIIRGQLQCAQNEAMYARRCVDESNTIVALVDGVCRQDSNCEAVPEVNSNLDTPGLLSVFGETCDSEGQFDCQISNDITLVCNDGTWKYLNLLDKPSTNLAEAISCTARAHTNLTVSGSDIFGCGQAGYIPTNNFILENSCGTERCGSDEKAEFQLCKSVTDENNTIRKFFSCIPDPNCVQLPIHVSATNPDAFCTSTDPQSPSCTTLVNGSIRECYINGEGQVVTVDSGRSSCLGEAGAGASGDTAGDQTISVDQNASLPAPLVVEPVAIPEGVLTLEDCASADNTETGCIFNTAAGGYDGNYCDGNRGRSCRSQTLCREELTREVTPCSPDISQSGGGTGDNGAGESGIPDNVGNRDQILIETPIQKGPQGITAGTEICRSYMFESIRANELNQSATQIFCLRLDNVNTGQACRIQVGSGGSPTATYLSDESSCLSSEQESARDNNTASSSGSATDDSAQMQVPQTIERDAPLSNRAASLGGDEICRDFRDTNNAPPGIYCITVGGSNTGRGCEITQSNASLLDPGRATTECPAGYTTSAAQQQASSGNTPQNTETVGILDVSPGEDPGQAFCEIYIDSVTQPGIYCLKNDIDQNLGEACQYTSPISSDNAFYIQNAVQMCGGSEIAGYGDRLNEELPDIGATNNRQTASVETNYQATTNAILRLKNNIDSYFASLRTSQELILATDKVTQVNTREGKLAVYYRVSRLASEVGTPYEDTVTEGGFVDVINTASKMSVTNRSIRQGSIPPEVKICTFDINGSGAVEISDLDTLGTTLTEGVFRDFNSNTEKRLFILDKFTADYGRDINDCHLYTSFFPD